MGDGLTTRLLLLAVGFWAGARAFALSGANCSGSDVFKCLDGTCVPMSKKCDDKVDCKDGTDEHNCEYFKCLEPDFFRCDSGLCIAKSFYCDQDNDCGDNSDEKNCTNYKHENNATCAAEEWLCDDRLCIPRDWVCNGENDCLDGSDEGKPCQDVECDGFKCKNGTCIVSEWRCDGQPDCADGSDEELCDALIEPKDCTTENRRFLCKDGKTCVEFARMCDGTAHCPDASDESPLCSAKEQSCFRHECSHECVQTPTGPLCLCPGGYLQRSEKQCEDVNECERYGVCDQRCRNTAGSYSCYCLEDYELQPDGRTCRVRAGEAVLVFSSKKEIRAYYLQSRLYYSVARGLKQAVGVAFDGEHVYWSDIQAENEAIVRADEHGLHRELLVTSGVEAPEDLAVDWVTGNIYFTDAELQHIGVCSGDGRHCAVLVNADVQRPRGLALDAARGLMFWSDWGARPEIARAHMDGSRAAAFVRAGLHWPNGLVLDLPNERLYWVDAKLMSIESVRLDGTGRRVVLAGVARHPYAVAVFEDRLYWSDWHSRSIQSCDKFTGKRRRTLLRESAELIYDVQVFHPLALPRAPNPCARAGCSHLCLLSGAAHACACPQEYALSADGSCVPVEKERLLVVGVGGLLVTVRHQRLGRHSLDTLPVAFTDIAALAYDSVSGAVLVYDAADNQVHSVSLDTLTRRPLLSSGLGRVSGMAFDHHSNNLYWCDSELRTVEVLSLNTMQRAVLVRDTGREQPLSVALVPEQGLMFVAFRKQDGSVHIDRMHMDGAGGRTHVIEQGLLGPETSLLYDPALLRVFWADAHTGNIESTSVDGDDRHAFRALLTEPISLAVVGSDVFWTNRGSRRIYWADKHNARPAASNKKITLATNAKLSDMHLTTATGRRFERHACTRNNGNCSHVCVLAAGGRAACACPVGQELRADNVTCHRPALCKLGEFRCAETDACVPRRAVCDGKRDCAAGDDELDCAKKRRCPRDFFECADGGCVPEASVCDLHADCSDRSDELQCDGRQRAPPAAACPARHFRCADGRCVPSAFVCDGAPDCADGGDERGCRASSCAADEFRCNSGACVPATWECDQEFDCPDQSDEHGLCGFRDCAADKFRCANGRCVPRLLRCDQRDDCGDFSDELACTNRSDLCHEMEFACSDGGGTACVPDEARCNGTAECARGEDERDCCAPGEFECRNRKCILERWVCDKTDDCGDGSDEQPDMCDAGPRGAEPAGHLEPCEHGFRCRSGHCVDVALVCDGTENCYDGSDEHGACESACGADSNPCADLCIRTPSGPRCACADGFALAGDGVSCRDVDECAADAAPCSQRCSNSIGSFECGCHDGFVLRSDRRACKALGAPLSVVFAVEDHIYALNPTENNLDVMLAEEGPPVAALAVSLRAGCVYFASEGLGAIHRLDVAGPAAARRPERVGGVGRPERLAVDWATDNVYFVDAQPGREAVRACHVRRRRCARLVRLDARAPASALAVDARAGLLFYATTSWRAFGAPASAIYRAHLDGGALAALVAQDLGHVSGLAADLHRRRLYFCDQHFGHVHAVDYDGANRHAVTATGGDVRSPIALDLFEDRVYALTPRGNLVRCRLYGEGRRCDSFRIATYSTRMFVLAQQQRQPPLADVCAARNCSHLCVQCAAGACCVCADGRPAPDGAACDHSALLQQEGEPVFHGGSDAPTVARAESPTGAGSVVAGVLIAALLVLAGLGAAYYFLRRRSARTGKLDISLRFQNPAYGVLGGDGLPAGSTLQPGKHEYANPVHINTQEMQSTANTVLQKVHRNPFVTAEVRADGATDNKLIKI